MIDTIVRQVDIVKVSTDDLQLLRPDDAWLRAARGLLELGPAAVLVTDGPSPATVLTESGERRSPYRSSTWSTRSEPGMRSSPDS